MLSGQSFFICKPVHAPLSGIIRMPGDKSITHRAIIFAAIAKGKSIIHGFLNSSDCLATLKAFQAMGVSIHQNQSDDLIIEGVGKYGLQAPTTPLDCGNSGTSMRLLAGLLAAQSFDSQLTGDHSLLNRPMQRIIEPLKLMGANIEGELGKPPLVIKGTASLIGINYSLPIASAQVKSCLLLAGLYAKGCTEIVESAISRDHTERMLATFSYPIQKKPNGIIIQSKGELEAQTLFIPGDISSAAFFIVAATLVPDSSICIEKVGMNPSRHAIITLLQKMGANITIMHPQSLGQEPVVDIYIKYATLKGIEIPTELISIAIDEFPILCIAAACAKGQTIFRNAQELRVKESDRIAAMAEGLTALGIKTVSFVDGLMIEGGEIQGGIVQSFQDHRIAMAFAIAGAVAKKPIQVLETANINTSFPNFVNIAIKIGLAIQEIIHDDK